MLRDDAIWWLQKGPSSAPAPTELFSILVTTTGRPRLGSRHVLRYGARFWVGEVR